MHTNRFFGNPFPDYDGQTCYINNIDGTLNNDLKDFIKSNFIRLFDHWQQNFPINNNDSSVYTGTTGAALLYLKIFESKILPNPEIYLRKANELIEICLKNFRRIRIPTFVCGEIGMLATATLIYYYQNKNYDEFVRKILSIHSNICSIESNDDLPDEILYGRAGYLYTLLMLRSKIPNLRQSLITDNMIRQIIVAILESGRKTSKNLHSHWPLTYVWYNEPYVGAAHGYAGILSLLLESIQQISSQELHTLIRPTLDMIVHTQFSSGNFPACLNEQEDKLVHWCHGSPGLIYLLATAHLIFKNDNDDKYLQSALKAGNDIWQRGLLRKGYGICHGTSGNGYAFIRLYQLTNDQKHLYRALKFAEWCCNYGQHGCRTPDTPYSLFEGMAGTLYFLLDIINPLAARFPAFQL